MDRSTADDDGTGAFCQSTSATKAILSSQQTSIPTHINKAPITHKVFRNPTGGKRIPVFFSRNVKTHVSTPTIRQDEGQYLFADSLDEHGRDTDINRKRGRNDEARVSQNTHLETLTHSCTEMTHSTPVAEHDFGDPPPAKRLKLNLNSDPTSPTLSAFSSSAAQCSSGDGDVSDIPPHITPCCTQNVSPFLSMYSDSFKRSPLVLQCHPTPSFQTFSSDCYPQPFHIQSILSAATIPLPTLSQLARYRLQLLQEVERVDWRARLQYRSYQLENTRTSEVSQYVGSVELVHHSHDAGHSNPPLGAPNVGENSPNHISHGNKCEINKIEGSPDEPEIPLPTAIPPHLILPHLQQLVILKTNAGPWHCTAEGNKLHLPNEDCKAPVGASDQTEVTVTSHRPQLNDLQTQPSTCLACVACRSWHAETLCSLHDPPNEANKNTFAQEADVMFTLLATNDAISHHMLMLIIVAVEASAQSAARESDPTYGGQSDTTHRSPNMYLGERDRDIRNYVGVLDWWRRLETVLFMTKVSMLSTYDLALFACRHGVDLLPTAIVKRLPALVTSIENHCVKNSHDKHNINENEAVYELDNTQAFGPSITLVASEDLGCRLEYYYESHRSRLSGSLVPAYLNPCSHIIYDYPSFKSSDRATVLPHGMLLSIPLFPNGSSQGGLPASTTFSHDMLQTALAPLISRRKVLVIQGRVLLSFYQAVAFLTSLFSSALSRAISVRQRSAGVTRVQARKQIPSHNRMNSESNHASASSNSTTHPSLGSPSFLWETGDSRLDLITENTFEGFEPVTKDLDEYYTFAPSPDDAEVEKKWVQTPLLDSANVETQKEGTITETRRGLNTTTISTSTERTGACSRFATASSTVSTATMIATHNHSLTLSDRDVNAEVESLRDIINLCIEGLVDTEDGSVTRLARKARYGRGSGDSTTIILRSTGDSMKSVVKGQKGRAADSESSVRIDEYCDRHGLMRGQFGRGDVSEHNLFATLLLPDIEDCAKDFPPCIDRIHGTIREVGHLKYFSRLQLSLFLKDIGMPMDDSLTFWRHNMTMKPHKGHEYAYMVRHNYGKVGRAMEYYSSSCYTLISAKYRSSATQTHGCPFVTLEKGPLMDLLSPRLMDVYRSKHVSPSADGTNQRIATLSTTSKEGLSSLPAIYSVLAKILALALSEPISACQMYLAALIGSNIGADSRKSSRHPFMAGVEATKQAYPIRLDSVNQLQNLSPIDTSTHAPQQSPSASPSDYYDENDKTNRKRQSAHQYNSVTSTRPTHMSTVARGNTTWSTTELSNRDEPSQSIQPSGQQQARIWANTEKSPLGWYYSKRLHRLTHTH